MPPHCDSLDGPVVAAARAALDAHDVALALPFVPEEAEAEVRATFDRVLSARNQSEASREVADRLFFETVVRLHRAGEGAPYTGLRPAGLSVGPVIPLAEKAIEEGSADELLGFLEDALRDELRARLEVVRSLAAEKDDSVQAARSYVEAMLGYEVYTNHLYEALRSTEHHEAGAHAHHG